MVKEKLEVGVVGTGFIGPAHVEALRRVPVQVRGLLGSSTEKTRQKSEELGIETSYDSYEALLADPRVDVVHLTTPNYLHYEQARAALLADKHVVCEKPLTVTSEQSAELVRLAAKRKRVGCVNFNLRFYPLVQQAREVVQSGDLGNLFILQGSYLQDWLLFPTDWNWRLDPELGGSLRAVADIGSHWLDMVTFISGLEPEAVFADFGTFLPVRQKPLHAPDTFGGKLQPAAQTVDQRVSTEDYATILLRFGNGAHGVVTVSQVCAGRKNRLFFEISGSRASLAWDGERPNELWIGHRDRPNEIMIKDPALLAPGARWASSYPGGHDEGYPDTFKQLYTRVYQYIREGDWETPPDFPTFEDGHRQMLLGEAIERSAHEACWVKVG